MDNKKLIISGDSKSLTLSEKENESLIKEDEKYYFNENISKIDLEENFCSFQDNSIIIQPSLNTFSPKDNVCPYLEKEKKERDLIYLNKKIKRKNNKKEIDYNFGCNEGEIISINNNENANNEEETFHLPNFESNMNKIEDKKKHMKMKKDEKNSKQNANGRKIKN